MPQKDIIRIRNASFYAYHGVASDEQNLGGKFEVDVEIHCDLSAAFATDSLKRTVDYETVYAFIQKTVTQKKYYLLETLAATIAKGLLREFSAIDSVKVTIRKPHPPVKGVVDYVEVEVTEPHV
jgi:7,8-dihydroneopterin aldolase/epimerase/oxygenase